MRNKIITGLDIGTSKVCATIAEAPDAEGYSILGSGISVSKGISGGAVTDLAKLTESIAGALGAAEDSAGMKPHNIVAGVGGLCVKGAMHEGALSISSLPRVVTTRDVRRVMDIARDISTSLGEDPIHMIPIDYALDNQDGIENPLGLYGTKLKAKLYIVKCATNFIKNITRAVNNAGYEMNEIAYSGLASSQMLSDEEKADGAALVDIGNNVTEIVIFSNGKISFNKSLNAGGADLTEELSSRFNIPRKAAAYIKERYGTVYEDDLALDDKLTVDAGDRSVLILRSDMNRILSSKMKNLFFLIAKEIESSGLRNNLSAGVAMSGATLLMSGVVELAEKELGLPVRMCIAPGAKGRSKIGSNPAYSTSIALIRHGLAKLNRSRSGLFKRETPLGKTLYRFKQLLTDYF